MAGDVIDGTANSAVDSPAKKTHKSQRLLVSVFGLFAREQPIPASLVVDLMAFLGVAEPATRTTLSRLKRRGVIVSARAAGSPGYTISPEQRRRFEEGDERIFAPRRADVGDRWLLAAFSVPESRRNLRYQIRKALSNRGFGTVGSALWIAPGLVLDSIRADLERQGLVEFVEFFFADYASADDMSSKVASWWDLDTLISRYEHYLAEFGPVLERWEREGVASRRSQQAFVDYVSALTSWRVFPYLEAGLALEYLPDPWPGVAAERLFLKLHELLSAPVGDFVRAMQE